MKTSPDLLTDILSSAADLEEALATGAGLAHVSHGYVRGLLTEARAARQDQGFRRLGDVVAQVIEAIG